MTIIKDKNGNKLLEITDNITENFVLIAGKKFKIIKKETNDNEETIITINSSLLLED